MLCWYPPKVMHGAAFDKLRPVASFYVWHGETFIGKEVPSESVF